MKWVNRESCPRATSTYTHQDRWVMRQCGEETRGMLVVAELAQMEEPNRRVQEADAVCATTLVFLHITLALYNRKTDSLLKITNMAVLTYVNVKC